jgi:hypothetical protein
MACRREGRSHLRYDELWTLVPTFPKLEKHKQLCATVSLDLALKGLQLPPQRLLLAAAPDLTPLLGVEVRAQLEHLRQARVADR